MATNIVPQDLAQAQYADGVFIRLTGGLVYDCQPEAKRAGFRDAGNGMTLTEKAAWVAFCIDRLGYVPRNWQGAGYAH